MRVIAITTATAMALATFAAPASGRDRPNPVFSDSNSHYLDYKTSISEAKRELRSDLARANDEADRVDAWAEYRAEIADAEKDFRKEMAERGVAVPRGMVTVEEVASADPY